MTVTCNFRFRLALIMVCFFALTSQRLCADLFIPSPTIESAPAGFASHLEAVHMVDQSGLIDSSQVPVVDYDGSKDFESFVASTYHDKSQSGGDESTSFAATFSSPVNLDFDLGGSFEVTKLAIWNTSSVYDRAINAFQVWTDTQPDFSSATLVGSFANPMSQNGPAPSPPNFHPGNIFDLMDTTAEYVRIQVNSNHGDPLLQVGEVAFATPAAIPEPSAFIYFGFIGCILYGTRRQQRLNAGWDAQ